MWPKLGLGEPDVRFLSPAPNYHAAPFTFALMVLGSGGTVVCAESFDAAEVIEVLRTRDITHSQWVPTMLTRMLAVPGATDQPLGAAHRVAVTSGAPCPPEVKDRINDWWGDVLHEYYGASEGYGHTYISPAESRERRGSVGRPLGDAVVRVIDPDGPSDADAIDVAIGEVGGVCFEGRSPDGAVRLRGMGDRGRLDADGYLYLTGRASFMIISGGVNIYPEEIEATLSGHPDVVDASVFGTPHPDLGEQVVAVVQLREQVVGDEARAEELRELVRTELARYKAPKRITFVEELPRLPTGKLNKTALRDAYLAGAD